MSKVSIVVDGDRAGGWIITIRDGDVMRTYSPDHDHPMDAAQHAAKQFVAEFPHHEDSRWHHPVDAQGEKIPARDDITADPPLQLDDTPKSAPTIEEYVAAGYPAASYPPEGYPEVPSQGLADFRAAQAAALVASGQGEKMNSDSKAAPGDAAAGSAEPGPGPGAPEVSTEGAQTAPMSTDPAPASTGEADPSSEADG